MPFRICAGRGGYGGLASTPLTGPAARSATVVTCEAMTSNTIEDRTTMPLGTAIIVGVGPGLGLALARAFAAAGHPVAMLARDKARLDAYAARARPGRPGPGRPRLRRRRRRPRQPARRAPPRDHRPGRARRARVQRRGAPPGLAHSAARTRSGPTSPRSTSWAPGSRPTPSCHELRDGRGTLLFTGGGYALHPSTEIRVPVCRQGRAARLRAGASRPAGGNRRARDQRHDHERRSAAATRASTRRCSPGPTSTCTTSPRPNGSTS